MNAVQMLIREPAFETLRTREDAANATHWVHMHSHNAAALPGGRPCFSPKLVQEIRAYQRRLAERLRMEGPDGELTHVVLASDAEGVFNLGGDLDLFCRLIREQDREQLLAYARECVYGVYAFHVGFHVGAHSIALVQGDALGGGFEAALSCHTIVAESGVGMGLPEVLFDLFPGMGAYSFLCKRVSPTQAEQLMLEGNVYSSDELYKMGLVDVLVPRGEGPQAVQEVIRGNRRIPNARRAMHKVRSMFSPVSLDELMRITEVWVDTAMQLGDKSLRTMERLVRAQQKRAAQHSTAVEHAG